MEFDTHCANLERAPLSADRFLRVTRAVGGLTGRDNGSEWQHRYLHHGLLSFFQCQAQLSIRLARLQPPNHRYTSRDDNAIPIVHSAHVFAFFRH